MTTPLPPAGLSEAQWALLELAGQGEIDTTWDHPDARALRDLGLLIIQRFRPASAFLGGQTARITEAGRAALQEQR